MPFYVHFLALVWSLSHTTARLERRHCYTANSWVMVCSCMGMLCAALTHLMFTALQWYGHSHVHTTVGMARCVQAAVVEVVVQFAEAAAVFTGNALEGMLGS